MGIRFHRHHEVQRRLFAVGQKVLAMDYRCAHPTWTAGRILQKKCNVVYEVSVDSEVSVRHTDQLKATGSGIEYFPAGHLLANQR